MQAIADAVVAGCLYGLIGVGISLNYYCAKFLNFALGAALVVSAFASFYVRSQCGGSLLVAIAMGIVTGTGTGMAIEALIIRRIRARRASTTLLFVASIGILTVVENIIALAFGDAPRTLQLSNNQAIYLMAGIQLSPTELVIVAAAATVFGGAWVLLNRTSIGCTVRAVADNPTQAAVIGVSVDRTLLTLAFATAVVASCSGILVALDRDLVPSMGFSAILFGAAAAVVGGVGRIEGSLLGGLLIGISQHLGVIPFSAEWQDTLVFLTLVIALLARPTGILRGSNSAAA